ncbi:MAG: PH domain-containing protein [Armatimonadota bacterium]
MSEEEPRTFNTGPALQRPWLAVVLAAGCVAVAGSQVLIIIRGTFGERPIDDLEPIFRVFFASAFLLAAAGIAHALMESRNARVTVTDDGLQIRDWRGEQSSLPWESVAGLVLVEPRASSDVSFGSLHALTDSDEPVRLSSGLWQDTARLRALRRAIVNRLGLRFDGTRDARWWIVLPAFENTWIRSAATDEGTDE